METESDFDLNTSCEGNTELNPEGASTRNAPMISAPRQVLKRRMGGALVPYGGCHETLNSEF